MFRLRLAVLAGSALALATTAAGAQMSRSAVPSSMLPPAGLCRVWIDGVAPTRQPRVTDCATARANLRSNSRVIYGGSSNGRVDLSREERIRNEARLNENTRVLEAARIREQQSRLRNDDRYNRNDDRYNRNDDRYLNDAQRRQRELQKAEEKRLKAIEKTDRKRDKDWEKSRKHDGDDRNDHRRGDSNERGR